MKIVYILLILILQSCTGVSVRVSKKHDGIDKDLQPYINMFVEESKGKVTKKSLSNLTVGFHDYPAGTSVIGTCWPHLNEIDINKKVWNNSINYLWKKELIFHELGHCVLNRQHTNPTPSYGFVGWFERMMFRLGILEEKGMLKDGCPSSIMYYSSLPTYCTQKHYQYYIDELFDNGEEVPMALSVKLINRVPQNTCELKIINQTNNWNKMDQNTLLRAKKTCIKRYSGCLTVFIKTTNLSYRAICGE